MVELIRRSCTLTTVLWVAIGKKDYILLQYAKSQRAFFESSLYDF